MCAAPLLEARGLVKSYGGRRVVDSLSLSCERATVLGLLGPNGAGKTTTLRLLYGFIQPEAGSIHYDGQDFFEHRTLLKRRIGVCTQDDTLDYDFSVAQNLEVYGRYFRPAVTDRKNRVAALLERFGLAQYAKQSPRTLSGGYKRRLLIARSIIHQPDVLFLDEPTTGLDPKARLDVWELVRGMKQEGMGIILTTHYMDEAERLSDSLVVLQQGRAVATGTPKDVLGDFLGEHVVVFPAEEASLRSWLQEELGRQGVRVLDDINVPLRSHEMSKLMEAFPDTRFVVRQPNLDDLFLSLEGAGGAGSRAPRLQSVAKTHSKAES